MTITATCGHEIPDNDEKYSVTRKGYTRENERCLFHDVVCTRCYWMYFIADDILDEAEEQAWLHGKEE
jgi:hypothetical protein